MRALSDDLVSDAVRKATGSPVNTAVLKLAAGRPGRAIALQAGGASDIAETIDDAMKRAPEQAGPALLALAYDRGGPLAERLDLTIDVAQDWLHACALARANEDKDGAQLASAFFDLEDVRDQAQELNLDPAHALARTAQILARAAGR